MKFSSWRSLLALSLASSLALLLVLAEQGMLHLNRPKFSLQSSENLQRLNQSYSMHVEPLNLSSRSLQSSLLSTNSLEVWDENHMGLIATVNEEIDEKGLLILTPKEEKSARELLTIGEAYLQAIPEFDTIELDQVILLEGEPVYSWTGAEHTMDPKIQLSEDTAVKLDPLGPIVAIMDSGIDTSHPFFKDHSFLKAYNAVNDMEGDEVGHGTHIAGIIARTSPHARLASYKIVGAQGGRLSNVLDAFNQAIDDNVNIINTSFGLMNPSPALAKIVNRAAQKNIFIVSAAGNANTDRGFYPAAYEEAIAVAAVDDKGEKTAKSNYGSWVDVAAPGQWIRSTLPGGRYGYKSGTSQSTAVVSGLLAEYLYENEQLSTLEDIFAWLKTIGTPLTEGPLAGLPIVQ